MFAKDDREERFLTEIGAKWHYSNDVTPDQLSPGWNQRNSGRPKARMDDTILRYAAQWEAGSIPPAPILWQLTDGHEVLDGIQRLCSAELLKITRFSAYMVETDSKILTRMIRVLANHRLQGDPPPQEWSRQQAIQVLIIESGMSAEEVARVGGWKLKDIQQDHLYLDWSFKIRCAGGPETLPKGLVLSIAEHAKPEDMNAANKPVASFLGALKKGKFANGDAKPYIVDFFKVNRSAKKELYKQFADNLDRFLEDDEVQTRLEGRRPNPRSGETKLVASLKAVCTVTEELLGKGERIPYMEECFHLLNRAEKNLKELAKTSKAKA